MDMSIDLKRIYVEEQDDGVNKKKILNSIMTLYNIKIYRFIDDIETFKYDIIEKFNIHDNDLKILNKTNFINNYMNKPEKYLYFDKGIILFDIGMIIDTKFLSNINFILCNYDEVILNRIHDNYIIYFNKKLDRQDNKHYDDKLLLVFENDIKHLLLTGKIKNIPFIIPNKHLIKKIKKDLDYLEKINNHNYFKSSDMKEYKRGLINDISSSYYQVEYHFEKYNHITNSDKVISKLNKYNSYIDNIILETKMNKTNNGEYKVFDLFNRNEINKLYHKIKEDGIIIKMNDVLDDNFKILDDEKTKNISFNNFMNGIIIFMNELIKRKIIKTIRLYNHKMLEKIIS